MSDSNQMLLKEISSAVDEGRENCADLMLEVEELESEILHKRVALIAKRTELLALIAKRTELLALIAKRTELLADSAPPPPASEPVGAPAIAETRAQMLGLDTMLFEADPHTVAHIAAEVYGDASPRNIKRVQMRIHALKREGRVAFAPPLLAETRAQMLGLDTIIRMGEVQLLSGEEPKYE